LTRFEAEVREFRMPCWIERVSQAGRTSLFSISSPA